MILLCNVFITENRLNSYKRYNLPSFSRYDIFRYTLASWAVIPWTQVVLFIELDQPYCHLQGELEKYILDLMPDAQLFWKRNYVTADWRKTYELLQDDLIWFTCNDDHVFLDYNLDMVREAETRMQDDPEAHVTCYYSHWPELTKVAAQGEKIGNFSVVRWDKHDAVQIIKKELFRTWWFSYDFGEERLARVDYICDLTHLPVKCYIPLREMCRHFDGYSHVADMSNICPPLTIPPDFFEKNIKIVYGGDRREGWVHIDPRNPNYYAATPTGTDYRWTLEDLPLFWRGRITEIEWHDLSDAEIHARNDAIYQMTKPKFNSGWTSVNDPDLPVEWLMVRQSTDSHDSDTSLGWEYVEPERPQPDDRDGSSQQTHE